ncbi:MAG: ABC transporter ATP-binding protein [Phycisphaerales bacterium]|nr:ABC transporter ATP-binding protein [Phycisphaerales bacterium]
MGADEQDTQTVVRIRDLRVAYTGESGSTPVLNGVNLDLRAGMTTALVGASGSGKSTLALSLMRLLPRDVEVSGTIERIWLTHQANLLAFPEWRLRGIRGEEITMVFQSPGAALDPVMRIGSQMREAVGACSGYSRRQMREIIAALLADVELDASVARAYAHELSGGMQQRVMIAMAIANNPDLLIADEPTSALDVTVQSRIIALLKRLQREYGFSMLLITHDIAVAAQVADEIAVMSQGRIVECGARAEVLEHPQHALTRSLVSAARALSLEPMDKV